MLDVQSWFWIPSIIFPIETALVSETVVAFPEFMGCLAQGKRGESTVEVWLNVPLLSRTPQSSWNH